MLEVRPATRTDAPAMADLINAIITPGGTTAYEDPFDPAALDAEFISLPQLVSCFVAEEDGVIAGFQSLTRAFADDPLPDNWASIATFTRIGLTQRGAGSALFAQTLRAAREAGITTIDATIRADNTGGLAFYSRLGFGDYAALRAVPLKNGTPVDRIRKRFDIV